MLRLILCFQSWLGNMELGESHGTQMLWRNSKMPSNLQREVLLGSLIGWLSKFYPSYSLACLMGG